MTIIASTPDVRTAWLGRSDASAVPSQVLSFDGCIHNRAALTARLGGARHSDASDAALLAALYDRWGTAGLGFIVGDWSAAIRDGRTRAVVLASDFAGVRPLYYYCSPCAVLWSASLASLVEAAGGDAIDEEYVGGYLTVGGRPGRTPYEGILSVPPGHAVSITPATTDVRAFWSAPTDDVVHYLDLRRYDEQLMELFAEAVRVRLQSRGPVLAELSGGLDSSSIVCMARELACAGAAAIDRLVTISYVQPGSIDLPFIRDVEGFCDVEGIHLSTVETPIVSESAVGLGMPEAWAPVYGRVGAIARTLGASTLLTGLNGDLVMGNWLDDSLQVAQALRTGRFDDAWREAQAWSRCIRVPVAAVLWHALSAAWSPLAASVDYAPTGSPLGSGAAASDTSLVRGFAQRTGVDRPLALFSNDWMRAAPERRKHFQLLTVMRELRTLQVPEPILDLQYTHPFAHRPLLEFLMSVPADVLNGPGEPRRAMRRVFAGLWPASLRARRSKGLFGPAWTAALRPLAAKLLHTAPWQVVERGWVDAASLRSRLQRLLQGAGCNEAQLRQIILLEYWLRNRASCREVSAA